MTPDWKSVGSGFKYSNFRFWKEEPSLISLSVNTESEKHDLRFNREANFYEKIRFFGTFWTGGRDTCYWLERTCFRFGRLLHMGFNVGQW